jgi:hypothetical protein
MSSEGAPTFWSWLTANPLTEVAVWVRRRVVAPQSDRRGEEF